MSLVFLVFMLGYGVLQAGMVCSRDREHWLCTWLRNDIDDDTTHCGEYLYGYRSDIIFPNVMTLAVSPRMRSPTQ